MWNSSGSRSSAVTARTASSSVWMSSWLSRMSYRAVSADQPVAVSFSTASATARIRSRRSSPRARIFSGSGDSPSLSSSSPGLRNRNRLRRTAMTGDPPQQPRRREKGPARPDAAIVADGTAARQGGRAAARGNLPGISIDTNYFVLQSIMPRCGSSNRPSASEVGRLMKDLWLPREMRVAPRLDPELRPGPVRPRYALLLNPFYPKDPHASFGKHVLTPTLALTSIAGATPPGWEVRYWDENLLQGPPPWQPFPQVVGITVHLTFAERAYALARWYRQRGARVVLGGLHVLSCPDEAAPHADALAVGEGVQLWPLILRDAEAGALRPVYRGDYRRPYRDEPPPRRDVMPRDGFLDRTSLIATRGCHNRCGFSSSSYVFLLLP